MSSDFCRGLVSDDENNQAATNDAFDVLHFIAAKRLAAGKLIVIDATNVQPKRASRWWSWRAQYHCLPVAIVLDLPEELCHERNQTGPIAIRPARDPQSSAAASPSLARPRARGFPARFTFCISPEEVEAAEIERQPLWNNRKHEHGPFDIIGDIHGCYDELVELLRKLGYSIETWRTARRPTYSVTPPEGRKVIFLGDLVDRGPKIPEVLRLVMGMVEAGTALVRPGQPRREAAAQTARPRRADHPRPGRDACSNSTAEPPGFASKVCEVHRRAGQPLRAG